MEHYVTLFDGMFLPQGIALHLSLQRHAGPHTLWVVCVDDQAMQTLTRLNLPSVRLLKLSDFEGPQLKDVKSSRTRAEYCWTLTPFSPRFVFKEEPAAARVTYVDADLWFRKNPAIIFQEFEASRKQVLITEHAYAPEYDQTATSGRFCVQFVTFNRLGGESVRKWWEERCLEWCHARYEEGKFGDQMYLDVWPDRFGNSVHILSDKELMLAPWNATRFPYARSVCWHFHGLRVVNRIGRSKYGVDCGEYPIPPVTMKYVYREYVKDLQSALTMIADAGDSVRAQKRRTASGTVKAWILGYRSQYWRYVTSRYLPL